MAYRYTVRKLEEGTAPTKPYVAGWQARFALWTRVRKVGPFRLRWGDKLHGPINSAWEATRRATKLLERPDGPSQVTVVPTEGASWLLKRFKVVPPPVPDGPGTLAIDRIVAAVHRQFDDQWLVRDMGIYARKPGEHGYANAWDAGTREDLPAEAIHYRIRVMAEFLREQGWLYDQDQSTGLPVNGVIVLGMYWERGQGRKDWRPYYGQAHVSHFHVSGRPSVTGWI